MIKTNSQTNTSNSQSTTQQSVLESAPLFLNVTIYPKFDSDSVLANASVNLNNQYVIEGYRVLSGKNGIYVGMPSNKKMDGTYKETSYPITKDFRQQLHGAILNKYQQTISQINAATQEKMRQIKDISQDRPDTELEQDAPEQAPTISM